MIHAGIVEAVEPRTKPLEDCLQLTPSLPPMGHDAVLRLIGADHRIEFGLIDP